MRMQSGSGCTAVAAVVVLVACLRSTVTAGFLAPASCARKPSSVTFLPRHRVYIPPFQPILNGNPRCVPSALPAAGGNEDEKPPLPTANDYANNNSLGGFPIGSILLALIAAKSLAELFNPSELPAIPALLLSAGDVINGAENAPPFDFIATGLDLFFVYFGAQTLLQQTGVLRNNQISQSNSNGSTAPSLAGFECRVTLDVGREKNTWMDKDWAASGARLVLPVNVRFANDEIDLGFPGEEALGGRFCRRLDVLDDAITFVGSRGEVSVPVRTGGWATLPMTERGPDDGASKLRFFLDFPRGASRNDADLPAGRVYFSGVCFDGASTGDSPIEIGENIVKTPEGAGILAEGGLTIKKRGGVMNLYGALGDVNLVLGRFSLSAKK